MKNLIFNPYLPPWEYIPDGEPRIFGDRLYIFGSHDIFGGEWYCQGDYVSWSAPLSDLSDWKCSGTIYKKDSDPRPGNLFAPDCVKGFDGRYYLYYSKDDSSVISVAVCTTPDGEYKYLGDVHYENGKILGGDEGEYFMFDPSVLIDGERIWLYSGSSQRDTTTKIKRNMAGCTVSELCPDMLTVKTPPKVVLPGTDDWSADTFFEAPSARKIGDFYYIIYPVMNGSGLYYSKSLYPDRDFLPGGCIISTAGIGEDGHSLENPAYPVGNEHGGLAQINGKWYIFSHRNTNKTGYSRQGTANPVTIRPDGTIERAVHTSCGLFGKPFPQKGQYPAYSACVLFGKSSPFITQSGADGDKYCEHFIKNISDGVAGFRFFDFSGGDYTVTVTVRGKGRVSLSTGEKSAPVTSAEFSFENFKKIRLSCNIPFGTHPLYFTFYGENIDFMSFEIDICTVL